MNYRLTGIQYQETSRNRRSVTYSINQDEVYNRNMPQNTRETRNPENWRIRHVSVENPRNIHQDPKTMDFKRLVEAVNTDFLAEYLERIFKFLQGPDSEISFRNLTPFQEEFLVRLVDKKNLDPSSFESVCMYTVLDIKILLDGCADEFSWNSVFRNVGNDRVLIYQKIYLNRGSSNNSDYLKMPHAQSDAGQSDSDDYDDNEPPMNTSSQSNKSLSKKQRIFKLLCDSVGEPFMVSSMQAAIDLIDDDSRQNMVFKDQQVDNARFLKAITTLTKKTKLIDLLPESCYKLFLRLKQEKARGMSLLAREGRPTGRHRLRDVTMRKLYQPNKKQLRQALNGKSSNYDPTQLFLDSLSSGNKRDVRSNQPINESANKLSLLKDKPNSERVYNSKKGIDWCRGGLNSEANANEASVGEVSAGRGVRPPPRSKLYEALSQPIELDKAKGMMEKMGWRGGALGARGEGITEPIMPALDLKAGAGLGHTAKQNQSQRRRVTERQIAISINPQSPDFKLAFLDEILALLRGRSGRVEIDLDVVASEKDRQMMVDIADRFNERQAIECETEKEKDISCRILANMNNNKKLEIGVDLSRDSRLLTITRTKLNGKNRFSKRQRRRNASLIEEPRDCDVTSSHIDKLTEELRERHPKEAKKTLIALAFRITFLKKILKFVEDYDNITDDVEFQDQLTKKQRKFLENVIINVNKREMASYSTRTENNTYSSIMYGSQDFRLVIKFPDDRTFNLEKVYRQKRDRRDSRSRKEKHSNRDLSPETKHTKHDTRERDRERNRSTERRKKRSITPEPRRESKKNTESRKTSNDSKKKRSKSPKRKKSNSRSDTPNIECYTPELESYTPELKSLTPEMRSLTPELKKDTVLISDDEESINLSSCEDYDDDYIDQIDVEEVDDDLDDKRDEKLNKTIEREVIKDNSVVEGGTVKEIGKEAELNSVLINSEEDQDVLVIDTIETLSNDININDEERKVTNEGTIRIVNSYSLTKEVEAEIKNKDLDSIKAEKKFSENKVGSDDLSPASSKRSRNSSENSEIQAKRVKTSQNDKNIVIQCINMNEDIAKEIQLKIARNIDASDFLPLIECKGIINDTLVFESQNDVSAEWLQKIIKNNTLMGENLKIEIKDKVPNKEMYKMSFKVYDYANNEPRKVFERIKRYHPIVNIDKWKLDKVLKENDFLLYYLDVDYISYKVICDENFSLYAGIDRVKFSRIWS